MDYISRKPLCVPIPGMEVHLTVYFFHGVADRPPRKHTHPCHEIVCIQKNGNVYITLIPPLVEHVSKGEDERICSFLFAFTGHNDDDICQIIRSVKDITEIPDSFGGLSRLFAIKEAIEQNDFGMEEQLKAEFRLFFVKVAQFFHSKNNSAEMHKQTLDEERLSLMEEFFNIEMRYPHCNKQQLADKLGVCERQLTRILKETYNSSFSSILLESRMNMAQALLKDTNKSIEEIAESVGYTSLISFRSAYKKFFGVSPRKHKM